MAYNFTQFRNDLSKIEDHLAKEYSQVHTGRASPAILDSLQVDSYGSMSPIKNIASISIEDPRTLRISPWDKTQIKSIEKSIVTSNLGLGTSVDEAGLRVTFPPLTTESRERLAKVLKERLEDARISVRQEREKIWDDIQNKERAGDITEDDKFRAKEELQKIIDEANKKLEAVFEKKQTEVMNQ